MLLKAALALAFFVAAISTGALSIDTTINGHRWTTRNPAQAHASAG